MAKIFALRGYGFSHSGFFTKSLIEALGQLAIKGLLSARQDAVRESLCMRRPQTLAYAGEDCNLRLQVQRLESHRAMGIFEAIE